MTVKEKAVTLSVIRQAIRENWIAKFNGQEALLHTRTIVQNKLNTENKDRIDIVTGVILGKLASMF